MNNVQLYLTITLLVIEVIAFAWLILDNIRSKKKQEEIIQLEQQILKLEKTILKSENIILNELRELKLSEKNPTS